MAKKFCTKCGKQFDAVGREVICPSCKAQAAEETKRAAVLRAKRASWTGESVPVRISGRASTVIRRYGAEKSLPFAAALDALLEASAFFASLGVEWSTIVPYRSRRLKKSTDAEQDVQDKAQAAQDVTSKPQEAKQAAKTISKTSTAKASKTASKK